MSRVTNLRRIAVISVLPGLVAIGLLVGQATPAEALSIGECGPIYAYIGASGQQVTQDTSFNCTIDVPVITLQTCLNYQIFFWVWSGDQYCQAVSDENSNFSYMYAVDSPAHGRTYRIHAKAQIVPPAGVRCDSNCTSESWTNGLYYR